MLPSYLLLPCMQLSKMFVEKLPLVGLSVVCEILTAKLNVHMGFISQRFEQCAIVSISQKLLVHGARFGVYRHPQSRQAMVSVHPQKPHSWHKNQGTACLQMPDAELCICKCF